MPYRISDPGRSAAKNPTGLPAANPSTQATSTRLTAGPQGSVYTRIPGGGIDNTLRSFMDAFGTSRLETVPMLDVDPGEGGFNWVGLYRDCRWCPGRCQQGNPGLRKCPFRRPASRADHSR